MCVCVCACVHACVHACMLKSISLASSPVAYQKLLNWEPLLELTKLEIVDKEQVYSTGDPVQMELLVTLHGPKVSGWGH